MDGPAPDDLVLRHVPDEQYQLIVGMDHLTGNEKVSILSMLEDWHGLDCYWPRTEEQLHETMHDCYGLYLADNGLWVLDQDALV